MQQRISTCIPRGHPNREEEAGALDEGLVSQPSAALKDTIKPGGKNKTLIRPDEIFYQFEIQGESNAGVKQWGRR